MDKTFNIYCDESCHLENDHKKFMFLGSVSCAYPQVERHSKRIDELKKEFQRKQSLQRVFDRDITNNPNFKFQTKQINPTPAEGQDSMERLFTHLTTVITDKTTNRRAFDMARSVRLHWIKHHIEENKKNNMFVFSVAEPNGIRTYIYDHDEFYVIVLEPMHKKNEYYLLTAYYLAGKDKAREKIMKKYRRRLSNMV